MAHTELQDKMLDMDDLTEELDESLFKLESLTDSTYEEEKTNLQM